MTAFLQRLARGLRNLVTLGYREQATFYAQWDLDTTPQVRRLDEPRGRVIADRYVCGDCKGEFDSFARLQQHTIGCFREAKR